MRQVNPPTLMADWAGTAPSVRGAYHAVHPLLRDHWTRERGKMLVAAVGPRGVAHHAVVSAGEFVVIGRHTQCAFRLDDPQVSLRHLVLRWDLEGEQRRIRVWDLRTGRPIVTEDHRPTRGVSAEALLFATLGPYRLVVLPIGDGPPFEQADFGFHALPERRFTVDDRPSDVPGWRGSTVTHTRPPIVFGDEPPSGVPSGRIEVEVPTGRTERTTSDVQLERGMLFGRYERCQLWLAGEDRLSRVHLFVVRVGGVLWAVDTASSYGTRRNGAPVSAIALDGPASLLLAKQCVVRWTPVGVGPVEA
ncbi:MAG: FHA domain-containing protein [Myxococcota bacterium]